MISRTKERGLEPTAIKISIVLKPMFLEHMRESDAIKMRYNLNTRTETPYIAE